MYYNKTKQIQQKILPLKGMVEAHAIEYCYLNLFLYNNYGFGHFYVRLQLHHTHVATPGSHSNTITNYNIINSDSSYIHKV